MSEEFVKLVVKRGQDKVYEGHITYSDGSDVDLTDTKIWFTVKRDYDSEEDDAEAEFQLRNQLAGAADDSEILISTPATGGLYEVYLKKAHTQGMIPDNFVFDVQIDHPVDGIQYPTEGTFTLKKEVTRS